MHLRRVSIMGPSNPHRARHVHDGPELLVVDEGHGRQLSVRGEEPCVTGDVFLFPAGQPHNSYAAADEGFYCLVLNASPGDLADGCPGDGGAAILERLAASARDDNRLHLRPATAQRVQTLTGRAVAEEMSLTTGSACASRALMMQALVALARDPAFGALVAEGPSPPERHIAEARRWMELYWMQPIQVADLVALGVLGRSQFLARFHAETGTTVGQALLAIRVREAQRMLRAGEGSMLDVALACGFGSQSHFNHRFRSVVGRSPREWLRLNCAPGTPPRT